MSFAEICATQILPQVSCGPRECAPLSPLLSCSILDPGNSIGRRPIASLSPQPEHGRSHTHTHTHMVTETAVCRYAYLNRAHVYQPLETRVGWGEGEGGTGTYDKWLM